MHDRDDRITDAILSGSAYERLRHTERGLFAVPTPRALSIQAALLLTLSTVLPLYALFPDSVAAHVPTMDPFAASPKLLVLGVFGLAMQVLAALLLAALTYYRLRNAPLSEGQARTVFDVQRIATGLSIFTGGIAVFITVGIVTLGAAGGGALEQYLTTIAGTNPFTAMEAGLTVGELAIASVLGAACVLLLRWGVVRVLPAPGE